MGEILDFNILEKSKKLTQFNQAVIKLMQRANPMPQPPKELLDNNKKLNYEISINFSMSKDL